MIELYISQNNNSQSEAYGKYYPRVIERERYQAKLNGVYAQGLPIACLYSNNLF